MSQQISVLHELERAKQKYEFSGENEVRVCCPFHEDNTPSCSINIEKQVFRCYTAGCNKTGDFITFLARLMKTTRAVILVDLGKRYTLDISKVINSTTVERYHEAIWKAGPLLKELYNRGITEEDIRSWRLGEDKGRITIPIKNEMGLFVNVRRYLPGAPGSEKMRNTRGHGSMRLYPVEQLKYDEIVVCGGEIKAIVAAAKLNRHGIGAITATAGEGNWDNAFTQALQSKKVWVCLDIDREGQKAAEERCRQLFRTTSWVGKVKLDLDIDKFPHGDINDFVVNGGSLKRALNSTEQWKPTVASTNDDDVPEEMELTAAINASSAGKRLRVKAVVSAMDTAPYVIPKSVSIECDKSQKECALCSVFLTESKEFTIHPESLAILEMVACSVSVQHEAIMKSLQIPISCKACQISPTAYYNVEDVRISPQLEITNRASDRVMQPAICIGQQMELNESYSLVGCLHPHPRTQQSTLLISDYKTTQDALSTYKCDDLESLKRFQPDAWTLEGVTSKLDGIYADFEANVTRIFQRKDLHLTIDLAYHSPLFISFDDRVVKGWVEVLVLGDSSQGKSETALNMMKHYGLGEKVECKNASVAGLLGGLQQMGSRWFVTWGVIPTHDKRLVILEELKGANTEVLARLTDMRSSGIAEIPKIEKRKTHARTRLIALSNPRSDLQLSSYNFGIEAIRELVGGLEDVRRFDFNLMLSSADIDPACLNVLQRSRPSVPQVYDAKTCRALILWGWTRTPAQVAFDKDATETILDEATKLSEEFSDAIPLIDRGSCRFKIARLSAALAVRTFSATENGEGLIVRECHVQYIIELIRRVYGSDVMGYKDFTAAMRLTQKVTEPEAVKIQINTTPFPVDFVKQILHTNKIDLQDIQDWCGWERFEAQQLLSFFVRKHALMRSSRSYRKTAPFIILLKEMLSKDELVVRPSFIEDEF